MKVSVLKRLIKEIIKESGFKPLPREARPYKCTVCGATQSITTNHDGPVIEYCPKCSHSPSRGQSYDIPGRHRHCRTFVYDPSVNEVTQKDIRSTHPHPAMPKKYNDRSRPEFQKMTLDNLKAIKEKCKRTVKYIESHPELRIRKEDLQRELKLWKLCDDEIERRLEYINKPVAESQGISNNQVRYGTNCTGISHGVSTDPRSVSSVRDELNDPIMNGKLHEGQYRFDDFNWMKRGDGFGIPSDVYYGTILIGTIISQENGYLVALVKGPNGDRSYRQDPKKPFKTKNDAAQALHRAWKSLRHGEETKSF